MAADLSSVFPFYFIMFVLFWFLYFGDEVVLSRTPNEMTKKEVRRARVRFNRREEAVPFFLLFLQADELPQIGVLLSPDWWEALSHVKAGDASNQLSGCMAV